MTGMEVLDALNSRDIKIPVIVMTFHGSETLAVQAFRMGIKDYILKPFTISELIDSIERALTEVRLRQERDELTRRLMVSNQALEQRLKELNTLFGIGKSVTSLLDQDKLLSRLVEAAIYLTNADEGSLLLVDHETDELYMVAARGLDERVVRSFRLRVEDSLAGGVVTGGQALILTRQDLAKIKTSSPIHSLIYIPLKVKGRVTGVLGVNNRHQESDFTNHDLRLLSALADYAAISLENAQLFNQVESERTKLATLLSEIEEPVVVITGQDDRVILMNAAFQRTLGIDASVVNGQSLVGLLHNQTLLQFISTAPDIGNSRKGEIPLDDGRTFYATLTPIPEVGRAIIMQEITHFKELDRMKSDFVTTVSQDLRVPLTSIKEYTHMLKSAGELNERQSLFVERITAGLEQVTTLIDNLLDLSTIKLGMDPNKTLVDIGQLAVQVVADFQEQAHRKQQQLICLSPGDPAPVIANEARLRQVMNHLVDNALRYTQEKGQISTIVQVEDKQVICKVEDNGFGIPPADLPFVFDKFFRVKDGDRAASQGKGLGLALCKSIIESYSGQIWAESQPDQGSIFIFMLPIALVDGEGNPVNMTLFDPEALPV
jgi:two-component system NtrC family sensor kinase